jgi:hypothetical protein
VNGIKALVLAILAAFATSIAAVAANLNFLADSPTSHFNEEDVRLLREAAMSLLMDETVGASREWRNPHSTASGKLRITKAFESTDGFKCKVLRSDTSAAGLNGRATFAICEIQPGDWKLHPDAKPAAKIPESPEKGVN